MLQKYHIFILLITTVIILNVCQSTRIYYPPYPVRNPNDRYYREIKNIFTQNQHKLKNDELDNQIHYTTQTVPKPKEVQNWPRKPLHVGQISGVSVNSKNQPVIFHRAERIWDYNTFDLQNNFLHKYEGPIKNDTILTLDPDTGEIISSWGANRFYLPHGITIDCHDNIWVTDVALHQVFKFKPNGGTRPLLEFGSPFRPGNSFQLLCKPTSVAVAKTGEIFIADGYCNHRVLKFNAAGGLLRIIPNPPEFLSLIVPHGLALLENIDRICIADRENMRVVCPRAGLHITRDDLLNMENEDHIPLTINEPDMGRIFDVTALDDIVFAVNGPTSASISVEGLTIDPVSETVINHWGPVSDKFKNPHAIAISPNKSAIYVSEISPNRIWKFEL